MANYVSICKSFSASQNASHLCVLEAFFAIRVVQCKKSAFFRVFLHEYFGEINTFRHVTKTVHAQSLALPAFVRFCCLKVDALTNYHYSYPKILILPEPYRIPCF